MLIMFIFTKQPNSLLFASFIFNTITSTTLHSFLILFEFIFGLFPSLSTLIPKLYNYSSKYTLSPLEKHFCLFAKPKQLLIVHDAYLPLPLYYYFPFICFIILSLISFSILNIFYSKKTNFTFIDKFAINFFNIFFFRYFNYLLLDPVFYVCLNLFAFFNEKRTANLLLGLLILALICIYIINTIMFIKHFSLYLDITNTLILKSNNGMNNHHNHESNVKVAYPFMKFSVKYEIYILVIKTMVIVESNVFILSKSKVTNIVFTLDLCILIIQGIIAFEFLFEGKNNNFDIFAHCCNKLTNSLRKIIIFFSFIFQVFNILFYKNETIMKVNIFILSLICSIGVYYFHSHSILINALSKKMIFYIKDITIFLFCMELPKEYNTQYSDKKGLFRKKLKNLSDQMWIFLYNSLLIDHLSKCNRGLLYCKTCQQLNDNNNKQQNAYDVLYSIVFNHDINSRNSSDEKDNCYYNSFQKDYRDFVIVMLYNKIKGNSYEFFKGFISLMSNNAHYNYNLPTFVKNSLKFLVDFSAQNEKKHRNVLLKLITNISEYENNLRVLLLKFKEFIGEDVSSKRADTVIEISTKISKLRNELAEMIMQFDQTNTIEYKNKNKEIFQEENIKIRSLQGTTKYALVIQRFIVEIFTNQNLKDLHALNIEMMDDFLDFHFNNDTLMILCLKQSGQCSIITNSGLLENKNDTDINSTFPPQFQSEGQALLQKSVKMQKMHNNHNKFQFFIKHNEFIKYFDYNYEISNMLLEQNILLFGHYNTSYDKIMILKHHHSNYKDISDMLIINFSIEMGRLIKLRPSLIKVIYQYNQIRLKLSDLFTDFIQCNQNGENNHFETIVSKIRQKPITKGEHSFQCEIDYFHLSSNISQYLKTINISAKPYEIFPEEGTLPLSFTIPKIKNILNSKALSNSYYVLTFTKLFDINETHALYKINSMPEPENTSNEKDFELFPELRSIYDRANSGQVNNHESIFNKFDQLQVGSNSSVCVSLKENNTSTNIIKQKSIQKYRTTDSLINNEVATFKKVAYSARILKILLIPLLVIFLIIQILNTNEIRNVNNIYIKYNTLVCDLSNSFGSLLSLICIANINSSLHNETCQNYMSDYLTEYQYNKINFTDFSIIDFLLKENLFKVLSLSDNYGELVQLVYEFGDESFLKIINTQVLEIVLHDEGNDKIGQSLSYETFDTSIRNFLSSLMVIYSKEEQGARFYDIPIYFVTFYEKKLNFESLPQKHLSPIQKEIYQLMVNYVFFYVNFIEGEKQISMKIYDLRKSNMVITWVFIIIVIVLNVLLMGLNCLKIKSANELFRKIILSILIQVENDKTKEYLLKKIDNLLTIVELYYKKPSNIIAKIIQDQIKFNIEQYKNYKLKLEEHEHKYTNNNEIHSPNSIETETIKQESTTHLFKNNTNQKNDEKYILSQLTNDSYSLKPFYIANIIPLYLKNIIFNILHIFIIVIADLILITFYEKVFKYFDYVEVNLSFVLSLYNGLSVSYLHRLLNLTDSDFGVIVNRDFLEDGLINVYFRNAFAGYTQGNHLQREGNFKPITDFITPTCSDFYPELKDEVIDNYIKKYNADSESVYRLFESICEDLLFMTFGNLNWSCEEYAFLVINLNNKYMENDIESLMKFAKHSTLHKAYMHFYFYLRPCMSFFIKSVLTPSILEDFYSYLIIVWVYLSVNLFLEILLFILINCFVEKKLHTIKKNLFLFDNTLF